MLGSAYWILVIFITSPKQYLPDTLLHKFSAGPLYKISSPLVLRAATFYLTFGPEEIRVEGWLIPPS